MPDILTEPSGVNFTRGATVLFHVVRSGVLLKMRKPTTLWIAQLVRDGAIPVAKFVGAVDRQRTSRPPVGEIAVMKGVLTDAQVHQVLQVQSSSRRRFVDTAIELGFVSREEGEAMLRAQIESSSDLAQLLYESGAISRQLLSQYFRGAEQRLPPQSERRPPEWRASQSLAMTIASMAQLRPFSAVVQQAMVALEAAEAGPADVADLLEKDPAVSAAVLKVANSALYRRGSPCEGIYEACSRLGVATLRDLIMGLSVVRLIDRSHRLAVHLREHCAAVGALARSLAIAVAPQWRDRAFLAGLLHDVGKLLLEQSGELDYDALDTASAKSPDRVCALEVGQLGYDHPVIGELALKFWELPEPVATAVGAHHDPIRIEQLSDEAATLATLVKLADRFDYHMQDNLHFSAALQRELAESGDAARLSMGPADFEEMWVELVAVRSEAVGLFGSLRQ